MDARERLIATWAGISGSLYLVMVFAAALVLGKPGALYLAITAMGLNYIIYMVGVLIVQGNLKLVRVAAPLFYLIFIVGLGAGLALLA